VKEGGGPIVGVIIDITAKGKHTWKEKQTHPKRDRGFKKCDGFQKKSLMNAQWGKFNEGKPWIKKHNG